MKNIQLVNSYTCLLYSVSRGVIQRTTRGTRNNNWRRNDDSTRYELVAKYKSGDTIHIRHICLNFFFHFVSLYSDRTLKRFHRPRNEICAWAHTALKTDIVGSRFRVRFARWKCLLIQRLYKYVSCFREHVLRVCNTNNIVKRETFEVDDYASGQLYFRSSVLKTYNLYNCNFFYLQKKW